MTEGEVGAGLQTRHNGIRRVLHVDTGDPAFAPFTHLPSFTHLNRQRLDSSPEVLPRLYPQHGFVLGVHVGDLLVQPVRRHKVGLGRLQEEWGGREEESVSR